MQHASLYESNVQAPLSVLSDRSQVKDAMQLLVYRGVRSRVELASSRVESFQYLDYICAGIKSSTSSHICMLLLPAQSSRDHDPDLQKQERQRLLPKLIFLMRQESV